MKQRQGEVQKAIRSVRAIVWYPGSSKCYKDTSYTRTKRKVRYKFDRVRVIGHNRNCDQASKVRRAIQRVLNKAKIPYTDLLIFDNEVCVYQEFNLELA